MIATMIHELLRETLAKALADNCGARASQLTAHERTREGVLGVDVTELTSGRKYFQPYAELSSIP